MPLTGSSVLLVTVVDILAFSTLLFVISRVQKMSIRPHHEFFTVRLDKPRTVMLCRPSVFTVEPHLCGRYSRLIKFLDLKPISISVDLKDVH